MYTHVWIVEQGEYYEQSSIVGVFSTRERAMQAAHDTMRKYVADREAVFAGKYRIDWQETSPDHFDFGNVDFIVVSAHTVDEKGDE